MIMLLSLLFFVLFWPKDGSALTADQLAQVDKIADVYELQPEELTKGLAWLESLTKQTPKDDEVFGSQARLYFFRALLEDDKSVRIKKYQEAIDAANRGLGANVRSVTANFWKAAAIGKQGLDIGITRSLKNAHPMKDCLEIVKSQNEKYNQGGVYSALGRLYFKLPGWPLSFGNNKIALEYLKKSVEIAPDHIGNRVFYAEVLLKENQKEEARKQLEVVWAAKVPENRKREMKEYKELAEKLRKKL